MHIIYHIYSKILHLTHMLHHSYLLCLHIMHMLHHLCFLAMHDKDKVVTFSINGILGMHLAKHIIEYNVCGSDRSTYKSV